MDGLNEQLQNLLQQGPLLAIALAWLGGVVTSATPCVYPMLPITVGVIGAHSEGKRRNGFLLSLVYVAGLATVYGALGLFAAASGQLFGQLSSSPWGYFAVANMCLLFAVWMMGWIQMPQFAAQFTPSVDGKSGPLRYLTVFVIGALSGLVAAPCTAPVLATLLAYVATTGDMLYGGLLLFVFAYGMGALLILAGTFSGFVANLPKSGRWMNWSKWILALVMLLAGEYFLIQMGMLLF